MIGLSNKIVDYWLQSAEMDYRSMHNLFASGEYHWALFVGHLVIEKILKAIFVERKSAVTPRLHNLVTLATKADIALERSQKEHLDEITGFNIRARYSDYKHSFYKKCTKEFTQEQIQKIEELRKWLINRLETRS